jgi:hypothetical protein
MKTQAEILDEHFRNGGSLTVAEALELYGVYALSQRAGELRAHYAKPIVSEWLKLPNGKKVKRYRYVMIGETAPLC